ncbi:hypothetical protein ACIBU0_29445 [Streptomyces sp. NPDC049627]|uniref:hypothetical protein n=1 Tax=Streptomyces sp. NPDC049627 TaxID=3365595 RepID=UPI00378DC00E
MTARIERLVTSGTFEPDGNDDGAPILLGEILTDLAPAGTTDHPIALFDPRHVRVRPFRTSDIFRR